MFYLKSQVKDVKSNILYASNSQMEAARNGSGNPGRDTPPPHLHTRKKRAPAEVSNGQCGAKQWTASSPSLPESPLTSLAVSALRNEVLEKLQSVRSQESLDVGFSKGSKKPSRRNNNLSFYSEEDLRRDEQANFEMKEKQNFIVFSHIIYEISNFSFLIMSVIKRKMRCGEGFK